MRDHCGAVIIWEPTTHTYFYEKPCDHLPLLHLGGEEALALVMAGRVFAAWRGSALGRALMSALDKISTTVGGAISLPADEIGSLIFQPEDGPEAASELRWFAQVLTAIRLHRELEIEYRKPAAVRCERRTVHPLHLAFLDHRWVLVAHDPGSREPRKFLLGRIESARDTGTRFVPPVQFDIREYLGGSIGLFTGEDVHEVTIRFDAFAAPYIRERRWHPSQVLTELGSGAGVEITLQLNNLIDVRRWILSWGSHAKVVAPIELATAIRDEARAMLGGHK